MRGKRTEHAIGRTHMVRTNVRQRDCTGVPHAEEPGMTRKARGDMYGKAASIDMCGLLVDV